MDISIVNRVIEAYGGSRKVQQRFGYSTRMTVYIWRKRGIPRARVGEIHLDTKIPIKVLMKGIREPGKQGKQVKSVFEAISIVS